MIQNLDLFKIASSMARHSVERHSVIAENIANANTPGFKAQDIEPFQEAYRRASAAGQTDFRTEALKGVASKPDGNNVSLEDQMARSATAVRHHETAITIYSKAISMLRASLGGR